MQILRKATYKRSTWKNGLGYTDEIAIFPPDSTLVKGDFLWRLSSARIENASPFSLFPSHDRVLVVLKGEGLRMIHNFEPGDPDDTSDVLPLQPYEFPGDVKSRCELLRGPITDLSLFVRTGEMGSRVQVQEIEPNHQDSWNPAARWNYCHIIEGKLTPIPGDMGDLGEGDTLSVPPGQITLSAGESGAKLVWIELDAL